MLQITYHHTYFILQMCTLRETVNEYIGALQETDKKVAACPPEVLNSLYHTLWYFVPFLVSAKIPL